MSATSAMSLGARAARLVLALTRKASNKPGITVPLLVASLMICASVAVSKHVLNRLTETQSAHFHQLTGAYLDGLSTALQPYVLRHDPWEAFDVIDRARTRYSGIDSRLVLVVVADETILAASEPLGFPLSAAAPEDSRPTAVVPHLDAPDGLVWVHRKLSEGGVHIGRIAAQIDVRKLQQVRRETFMALLYFNAALTLVFVLLGWLLVRRMMKPMLRLSDYLARSSDGRLEPISPAELPPADTAVGRAYRRYNAAAAAIAEREALLQRLAEEERRALIGRYASAIAHEVNNPLGGLFNAVKMIQRHGEDPEQRQAAAQLIERGLTGIRNVVRASLMTWRGTTDDSVLKAADVEDLRYLIQSEASRRDLKLVWRGMPDFEPACQVPAQAIRQIALNLLLNACAASPPGATVSFEIRCSTNELLLSFADEGPGMPTDAINTLLKGSGNASSPVTGIGLWAVARLVESLSGSITVAGPPGTCVTVRVPNAVKCAVVQAVA
ncbi:MAG: sensor histidine kinase [Hyphomicrobiaceae bacterium]